MRYLREINIEEEGTARTPSPTFTSSTSPAPCNKLSSDQQQNLSTFASPLHDHDCEEGGEQEGGVVHADSDSDSDSDTGTGTGGAGRVVAAYSPTKQHPWTTTKMLCQSKTFWRFSILTLFLVNLHAIFRHLDATLPTYLVRSFGNSIPKGSLYSINPFMIIFLTPLVAACTNTSNHFDMIKYGGYVTAISPFFLAVDTSIGAVVCMLVVLSLGEAIWSPRLYDYVMTIAPEGRESSFSALASAPLFAAKIPVGLMSGYLLHKYLPEQEEGEEEVHQDPQTMWLIIGIMTLTSPVLITLFDSCIREPEHAPHALSAQRVGEHDYNHTNGGNSIDEGSRVGGKFELGVMNYTEEEDEEE